MARMRMRENEAARAQREKEILQQQSRQDNVAARDYALRLMEQKERERAAQEEGALRRRELEIRDATERERLQMEKEAERQRLEMERERERQRGLDRERATASAFLGEPYEPKTAEGEVGLLEGRVGSTKAREIRERQREKFEREAPFKERRVGVAEGNLGARWKTLGLGERRQDFNEFKYMDEPVRYEEKQKIALDFKKQYAAWLNKLEAEKEVAKDSAKSQAEHDKNLWKVLQKTIDDLQAMHGMLGKDPTAQRAANAVLSIRNDIISKNGTPEEVFERIRQLPTHLSSRIISNAGAPAGAGTVGVLGETSSQPTEQEAPPSDDVMRKAYDTMKRRGVPLPPKVQAWAIDQGLEKQ